MLPRHILRVQALARRCGLRTRHHAHTLRMHGRCCSTATTTPATEEPSTSSKTVYKNPGYKRLPKEYEVVCSNPYPDELKAPLSSLWPCVECDHKVFATERALRKHQDDMCKRPFECDICFQKFRAVSTFNKHKRWMHLPFRPQFKCDICGDTFLRRGSYRKHVAENPFPHKRNRPRNIEITDAMLRDDTFGRPDLILEQSMYHHTTLRFKKEIEHSSVMKPNKNSSMVLDGVMLREDAPPGTHFRVTPAKAGAMNISSFVPAAAEPGEAAARILLSLSMLESGFRMYLASVGNESFRGWAGVRATVVMARENWWTWADEHCRRLDMHNNPLLRVDKHTREWHVATRFRDKAANDSYKLTVTIVVADGLAFSADQVRWQRIFRLHHENGKSFCPLCGVGFKDYPSLFNHEMREHQERMFICGVCPDRRQFTVEASMREHNETFHEGRMLHCALCSTEFRSRSGLESHLRVYHKAYKGRSGRIIVSSDESLDDVEGGPDGFTCDLCQKVLSSEENLRRHIVTVHQSAQFTSADRLQSVAAA